MARKLNKTTTKPIQAATPTDCSAIYVRVSTDRQAEEGYSLDAQRARLEAYCTAQDWQLCPEHIYIDAGESAKTTVRPAYQRMIAAIDAGIVRRAVAVKLDRLSRNTADFLNLLDYCDARQVGIVSIAESFDTSTPVGRAVVTVLMAFAELERQQITGRVMVGKGEKAKRGGFNGAPTPYGYTYTDGQFGIDEERAATIRSIFDEFIAGSTMTDIARRLDAENTPTARGGTWAAATLSHMLRNGAYAGLGQWDGVEATEGTYPAIVTIETYEAAIERLQSIKRGKPAASSQGPAAANLAR